MARLSSAPSKRYSQSHRSSISRVEIEQFKEDSESDDELVTVAKSSVRKAVRGPRARKIVDESESESDEVTTSVKNDKNDTNSAKNDTVDDSEESENESQEPDNSESQESASEDYDMEDVEVDGENDTDSVVADADVSQVVEDVVGDENVDLDGVSSDHVEDHVDQMTSGHVTHARSPLSTRVSLSSNSNPPVVTSNPSPSQKENVILQKRDSTPPAESATTPSTPTTPSRAPPSSLPVPSPHANVTIDDAMPDGLPLPRVSEEPEPEQLSHGIHARSLMQQRATSMQQHVMKVPDEPMQRLTISNLVLTNFKSYAGRQEVGPFHSVSTESEIAAKQL